MKTIKTWLKNNKKVILTSILVFVTIVISAYVLLQKVAGWVNTVEVIFPEDKFTFNINVLPSVVQRKKPEMVTVPTDDAFLINTDKDSFTRLMKMVENSGNKEVAMLIVGTFSKYGYEEAEDMLAIITAESGLRTDSMGWNCIHYGVDGQPFSEACHENERDSAWSVDCGAAQLNFSGRECPDLAFNPVWNIQMAEKKYLSQGKNAWVVYWKGLHNSVKIALAK